MWDSDSFQLFTCLWCLRCCSLLLRTFINTCKVSQGIWQRLLEFKGAVCESLKQLHTDEEAVELYDTVKALCAANQIPEPCATSRQRQKCMEDYVVESSCGAVSDLSDSENLKRNLFLPCLDRMVAAMDQRFSSVNSQILQGVQACDPQSDNFLREEHLSGLAGHYRFS